MSQSAHDPDVRQFASNTTPTLENHLKRAQDLQQSVGATTSTTTTTKGQPPTASREKPGSETTTQAAAGNENERQLPGTASYDPALLLVGLLSLVIAARLRLNRNQV